MSRFIHLHMISSITHADLVGDVYIDADIIKVFKPNKDGTTLVECTDVWKSMEVTESAEEVLRLIKDATEDKISIHVDTVSDAINRRRDLET